MLHVEINKELGSSLIRQIYQQVRDMILEGQLKAGDRLPSTREMAENLSVSRNTVLTAYDMLIAEGYIFGKPGSGVFVSPGAKYVKPAEEVMDYGFSAFSRENLEGDMICFHSGTPALELFPRSRWNRIYNRLFQEAPVSALGYDDPQGRPELRDTLASYLRKTRGINCHPDQIIITSGAKQGLTLVAKCLLSPESTVFIEDPSNDNVRRIFSYHTDRIIPIPVDSQGIDPGLFPPDTVPALIFVTPSHQFPMGGVLSIQRRLELLSYARETGCYVVEDDYDSEFRYRGLPVSAMQELDIQHVIYVGTFSKVLFPSLRLGYLVLPFSLVEICREWKRLGDHHSNSLSQLTLLRFIESGELERHISRMKKVYRKRRDYLMAGLERYFPGGVKVMGETAGMHLVAKFQGVDFTPGLMHKLHCNGVDSIPVEDHAIVKGNHRGQLILGYAHLGNEEIEEGLARIRKALTK